MDNRNNMKILTYYSNIQLNCAMIWFVLLHSVVVLYSPHGLYQIYHILTSESLGALPMFRCGLKADSSLIHMLHQ